MNTRDKLLENDIVQFTNQSAHDSEQRLAAALVVLLGMVVGRQVNDAKPMPDMCRCWRLDDQFLDAGKQ